MIFASKFCSTKILFDQNLDFALGKPLIPRREKIDISSTRVWYRAEKYFNDHLRETSMIAKLGYVVEGKFGEQNFRVFSEMRRKFLYCNPKNFKKSHQNQPKCMGKCRQNLKIDL